VAALNEMNELAFSRPPGAACEAVKFPAILIGQGCAMLAGVHSQKAAVIFEAIVG
jgi:hypothetical protein